MRSHPTWVCGLKQQSFLVRQHWNTVTPYVGVWIETSSIVFPFLVEAVTPYVGVWIETQMTIAFVTLSKVTPYVGVWIET